jgi:hypothetical protein
LILPPPQETPIQVNGYPEPFWVEWFKSVRNLLGFAPFPLRKYTVSTLPPASDYEAHIVFVDAPVYSDGTNWRKVSDDTIII